MAGARRQVSSRKSPRSAAIVGAPPSTCSSAEAAVPSGWYPWIGCSSCCGSPSSPRFLAAAQSVARRRVVGDLLDSGVGFVDLAHLVDAEDLHSHFGARLDDLLQQ